MFERYTEKARRTIFFARYEASQAGAQYIEPPHLLLGLLREDRTLLPEVDREAIRKQVEAITTPGPKVSTSVDMPLSDGSKRVLDYGADEAERLASKEIGTPHLLLGLLREEGSPCAQWLKSQGVELNAFREKLASAAAAAPRDKKEEVRALIDRLIRKIGGPRAGIKVADTTRTFGSHEIRTIERIDLSEDGKQLLYKIEVQGPGNSGTYKIAFDLGDEKEEKES